MSAADYWTGGAVVDDSGDDAAAFGLELPDLESKAEHCEVWPEAWPAVDLFLKVQTQWRGGASGIIGLDYQAVRWLMELYEFDDQRTMLEDLQVIEARVIVTVNSRKG
jgi:hypothetical protein